MKFLLCGLALALSASAFELAPFLETHCLACHGETKQKADRRFDQLKPGRFALDQADLLQEILDQLNLGEMPPDDEPQPDPAELKAAIAYLTEGLAKARAEAEDRGGAVVLRRLNRNEYRNTVRDLFSLSMADFDPTRTFPADDTVEGFDNIGEGLTTSDALLGEYLQAARLVADKAVRPGPEPERIHLVAVGEEIMGKGHGHRPELARIFIKDRQPLGITALHKRKIRESGEYRIRIVARAYNRKSRYQDEHLRYDSDEPMRMSVSIRSQALGPNSHRVVRSFEVPDDKPTEFVHRLWLDETFCFYVHWANGPDGSTKRIMRKVLPKYTDDAIYPLRNPIEMYAGSGPELQVYRIEIEGPFFASWPPPGFARYFPDPPEQPGPDYLDASLRRLAAACWRRPPEETALAPYLALARSHLARTEDFWDAARYGVRALLTSPQFLYLVEEEPREGASRDLDAWELASRLSYFLWSSMPDDALFEAAADGSLLKPAVLRRHSERMLADPRAESFIDNFAGQWLQLRKLGEMPPDPASNRAYFEDDLESAMIEETHRLFGHLLDTNGSLLDFVDADYTFVNPALARHYDLPEADRMAPGFQRVSLSPTGPRGGLLGHGSVLTLTSNGVESQPVVRGVWILENLLGTPPNPPPPDIEPLEPDTRGVATIRELMDRHREHAACNECHRKIDPLGLGLEEFDHVGRWRDRYTKTLPIDVSGNMPDGTAFVGTRGIREFIAARPAQFAHCLTEKMLTYALGRRLSFTDRDDIELIVAALPDANYGLRELVHRVIATKAFRSK